MKKNKRIIKLVISIFLTVAILFGDNMPYIENVRAESYADKIFSYKVGNSTYRYSVNDDGETCMIVKWIPDTEDEVKAVIPEKIHGYVVNKINTGAFMKTESLEEVTIPSCVTKIYNLAFMLTPNVVIACVENSEAHEFAARRNMKYRLIDETEKPQEEETTEVITSVKINKSSYSMIAGKTYKLKASVKPVEKRIKWKSSNNSIATVSSSGVVKAKKGGKVTITASVDTGESAVCKITVKKEPQKISLNKTKITLKKGGKTSLKYTITKNSYTTVQYKSSNEKIAKVSQGGTVKGIKKGTAIITATTANGKVAKCKITVK